MKWSFKDISGQNRHQGRTKILPVKYRYASRKQLEPAPTPK